MAGLKIKVEPFNLSSKFKMIYKRILLFMLDYRRIRLKMKNSINPD